MTENAVFRKLKEISERGVHPRPLVRTSQLASELSVSPESLAPQLAELKQMRLVKFIDAKGTGISLTLLGCVVKRDK